MSRCHLNSEEHDVAIGWDKSLKTYFLQVFDNSQADPIIEKGHSEGDFLDPAPLVVIAAKYGCPFDRQTLLDALRSDQANNSARGYAISGGNVIEEQIVRRPNAPAETHCPHCRVELNGEATTCHACGAYKSVQGSKPVLLQCIVLSIGCLILAALFSSVLIGFVALVPIGVYQSYKSKLDKFKGWIPSRS
ncbi:MAG: hypothetical protein ACFHHU_00870 [Porticoccaceae bacterium]